MKKLLLIRGAPGSGKTTLAKRLKHEARKGGLSVFHVEADDFFTNNKNEYRYAPERLHQAHNWCKRKVASHVGFSDMVIVANCFTYGDHLAPYVEMGLRAGVEVELIECTNKFENVHDVPNDVVDRMRANADTASVLEKRFPEVKFRNKTHFGDIP